MTGLLGDTRLPSRVSAVFQHPRFGQGGIGASRDHNHMSTLEQLLHADGEGECFVRGLAHR
jgi:hypothetical protein